VVLAPPNTVLKTSSGKVRRAASREIYERGQIGKAQKAVSLQIFHVLLAALIPQLRSMRQLIATRLYGIYARTLFWMIAPFVWTAVAIQPWRSWRWVSMRSGARLLARTSFTPFTVKGLEQLPPPDQPCVYVANHASYLDGPVLVAACTRQFSFVAKAELLDRFIPRVFLKHIQARFVERFDQQKGIIDARQLATAVQQGQSLMFFPEGTFTRVSGLLPFHMGAFAVAAEANVPIVPVAIRGTRSILRAGAWFPHHGAIRVIFGEPIYPDKVKETATDSPWMIALKLRDATRQDILRHCGEPDLAYEKSPLLNVIE
jgi:1-acyl-sn-glycerol-3-phosphate acyltransferase